MSTPPIKSPVRTRTMSMAVKLGQYINIPVKHEPANTDTNNTICGPIRSQSGPQTRVPIKQPVDVAVNSHDVMAKSWPIRSCISGKAGPRLLKKNPCKGNN